MSLVPRMVDIPQYVEHIHCTISGSRVTQRYFMGNKRENDGYCCDYCGRLAPRLPTETNCLGCGAPY